MVSKQCLGDGTEALFSVVVFLGEKILQQEMELGMLKQELKVINVQHQVVGTLVPKVGCEKHGNNPTPGKPALPKETPPRADLTTSTPVHGCAHAHYQVIFRSSNQRWNYWHLNTFC